ncbi:MAG: cyclic nucleotide-binding domain-containing protein [Chlamydiales bacterium]
MNLLDKAFLLKKTPLFESVDLDLLLTISDKMERLHYKQEEKIFQVNQEAYRMYLIVSGTVVIQDKSGKKIIELTEGEFFGEEAIFNGQPRAYNAVCKTTVTLLALSQSYLLSIIAECPSVAIAFLEVYTKNIGFRSR